MAVRREPVDLVCVHCKKHFSSIGTRLPMYCSRDCKEREYRDRKRKGVPNHQYTRRFSYNEDEDVMG